MTECPGDSPRPVFLYSSWRTSSTWLWQQFRSLPETLCFYEPFNEDLAGKMTHQMARERGADSWQSGHAQSAPYFLEYMKLIRKSGGIRLNQPSFAFDWYVPEGGLNGSLRPAEVKYLALLLRTAGKQGRIPVLGCVQSLGRMIPIKRNFGGVHLFLHRNLWGQWMSFLDQRRKGQEYFYRLVRVLADQPQDRFLTDIHNFYFRRCIELASGHGVLGQLGGVPPAKLVRLVFDLLPEGQMFEMFMAVHLYLYLHAFCSADVALDSTRMARDPDYRRQCEADVLRATGLAVDFSGSRQDTQRIEMINGAVDWPRIAQHARLAAASLQDFHDRAVLDRMADDLIAATIAEMPSLERP